MISFPFLEKYAWWHREGKTTAKKTDARPRNEEAGACARAP